MKDFLLTFTSLKECKLKLNELLTSNPQGKFRLSVVKWTKKRGINANGLQHLWYTQIANSLGYQSEYIKDANKVMFGVEILLTSQSPMAERVVRTLEMVDFWSRDWLVKIDIISGLDCTCLFNTAESKVYMDQMILYWNDKNVPIKFKD